MIKERIITREYLNVLDNEIELIPLTFDIVFKCVFIRNIDLLKRFLNEILDLDLDMSMENFNIHEWHKEKMDELVKYNHYKDGM